MDKLICSLIKKNFVETNNIISTSDLSSSEYCKLIQYLMYQYIQHKISDVCLFMLLYLTITKHKIVHFSDIQYTQFLIDWHKKNCYFRKYTYIFITTYNNLSIIDDTLTKIILVYLEVPCKFNKFNTDKSKRYSFEEFRELIKIQAKPLINSYNDNLMNIKLNQADKNKYDEFINLHTNEMLIRLKSLVRYFGLHILEKNEINVITNIDFLSMSFAERIDYYAECINKLNQTIFIIDNLYMVRDKNLMEINGFNIDYDLLTHF